MKTIFCLMILCAARGSADEAADRAAITRTIVALNELPRGAGLFTADTDALPTLERLWAGKRLECAMGWGPGYRPAGASSGSPRVVISHEPWGEAAIVFPEIAMIEGITPRIAVRTIRFITPDVALANGVATYHAEGTTAESTPLLFVLKKEKGSWEIASLRVLAAWTSVVPR